MFFSTQKKSFLLNGASLWAIISYLFRYGSSFSSKLVFVQFFYDDMTWLNFTTFLKVGSQTSGRHLF